MAKIGTLSITGKSGTEYNFTVYSIDTSWKKVGAVYAVTKRTVNSQGVGNHTFIYIGETGDMDDRHGDPEKHHKSECFKNKNANCISVHRESNSDKRLAIEKDILEGHDWPCNG